MLQGPQEPPIWPTGTLNSVSTSVCQIGEGFMEEVAWKLILEGLTVGLWESRRYREGIPGTRWETKSTLRAEPAVGS